MRPCSNLAVAVVVWAIHGAFACEPSGLQAQDKEWKPPEGWKKVAAAQFAEIGSLLARDGHLCWMESRLVPETARFRAPSFERRLYRLRLGEAKAEQVYRTVSTGLIEPLMGPGGAIATMFDYPEQHLFLPGQPPAKLPQVEAYHPKEFTSGGLLCHAQRYSGQGGYYDSSLALIPIVEGKARADDPQVLLPWGVGELSPQNFQRWGTFRRGDYLISALPGPAAATSKPGKSGKRPGRPMLTVWDVKKKAKVWDVEGIPIAADDRHVYSYSRADQALVRRSLAGPGEGSQWAAADLDYILDFRPPKLLGLFREKREWVLSLLDVDTGDRSDFDVRISTSYTDPAGGLDTQNRPLYLRIEGSHAAYLGIARDAETGALYAGRGAAIYEVPVVTRRKASEPPNWKRLP